MLVLPVHSIVKWVFRNCAVNRYRTISVAGSFASRSDYLSTTYRSGNTVNASLSEAHYYDNCPRKKGSINYIYLIAPMIIMGRNAFLCTFF